MKLRALLFALPAVAVVGCTEPAAEGGFGEAKPVKNDGMIGKPQPLPEAPPDWASALAIVPAYDQATQTLTLDDTCSPKSIAS
jgi:hypothetical protein